MPCQDKTQSMLPTKHICLLFLHPSPTHSTLKSLTRTRTSNFEQPIKSTFASLSLPGSTTSGPFILPHVVWVRVPEKESKTQGEEANLPILEEETPAITGIEAPVVTQHLNANTSMSAIAVGVKELIDDQTIYSQSLNQDLSRGPKFRRHFVWDPAAAVRSRTVRWTEYAEPLPFPPASEYSNLEALDTIHLHPELFQITTPINIDHFEPLLSSHPNQPFVKSVCRGLQEGFCPFANIHYGEWPLTWDNFQCIPKTAGKATFLQEQADKEIELGCFSEPFGPDLLPEIYSMPIHAVPKPGTSKFHLVTDHNAGQFALNNIISHEDIAGVTLNNVQDLGNALCYLRAQHPNIDLILWKADVSEAYRHIPMHPLWQIKQVITIHSKCYVDQCNIFGGHASQHISSCPWSSGLLS